MTILTTVVALAIMFAALPTTGAAPTQEQPGAAIVSTNANLAGPPGVDKAVVHPRDLDHGKLADAKMLAIGGNELQSATPGARQAVERFVARGGVLVVTGPESGDAYAYLAGVTGADFDFNALSEGLEEPALGPRAVAVMRAADASSASRAWRFESDAGLNADLLRDAAQWKNDRDSGQPGTVSLMSGPSWSFKLGASYCYSRSPNGQICYDASFYKLLEDGSSAWDWWDIMFTTTTAPGKILWGNNWHTNRQWLTSPVDYYNPHQLVDYGPGSYYGADTASYCVGPTAGVEGAAVTASLCESYIITDVSVSQESSKTYDDFYVRHDILKFSTPAGVAYSSYPGFTVRTTDSSCLKIPYTNKAEWREYMPSGSDNFYQTWTSSWRQVC